MDTSTATIDCNIENNNNDLSDNDDDDDDDDDDDTVIRSLFVTHSDNECCDYDNNDDYDDDNDDNDNDSYASSSSEGDYTYSTANVITDMHGNSFKIDTNNDVIPYDDDFDDMPITIK